MNLRAIFKIIDGKFRSYFWFYIISCSFAFWRTRNLQKYAFKIVRSTVNTEKMNGGFPDIYLIYFVSRTFFYCTGFRIWRAVML